MQEKFVSSSSIQEYSLNIPGRMRVKIESLKNNESLCSRLIESMTKMDGIQMVTANPYTGKVLLIYDVSKCTLSQIEKMLSDSLTNKPGHPHKGKVLHPDFHAKRKLTPQEFYSNRVLLSHGYYQEGLRTFSPQLHCTGSRSTWHTLSLEVLSKQLDTNLFEGLSSMEAATRFRTYGLNQFKQKKPRSLLSMFLNQFDSFIIKLLLGASGVSLLLGQVVDAAAILVIIGLESALGVWQEYKAERSLDALKQLSTPTACVIRDGVEKKVSSTQLVPGDVILLESGNTVPADVRLIESYGIEVMEASLTGESNSVSKKVHNLNNKDLPLGDRVNMLYMGTSVIRGRGKALVVSTGMYTEMGKIAAMLNDVKAESTPLQKDLNQLAKIITWGCLGICSLITVGGVLGGHPLLEMLRTGVSLAVGAIPEGLTTVLTISLAFGVQRMAKKNAIVKTLPAVETLSCTKVICTDKTGTLTQNEMTVKEIATLDKKIEITGEGYQKKGTLLYNQNAIIASKYRDLRLLLTSGALCNNAEIEKLAGEKYEIKGDPTEAALLIAVEKSGLPLEDFSCYRREHEIPFDADVKRMTAICSDAQNHYHVFSKGAVDSILEQCSSVMMDDQVLDISQEYIDTIVSMHDNMASRALRVLALAYKPLDYKSDSLIEGGLDNQMIFLGLVGMMDPPREGVKEAIGKCHQAGIKVVMITGDHKETAAAIAKSIDLLTEDGIVLSGEELDALDADALSNEIGKVQVFARTCPEQKLKIVRAFKKKGYIVAMTGDGVNDAPAIKEAHVGIAMGKSGTDVTREASSIILTDDNFSTIVKAVEEGRTINRNIKKFVKYVLSGNFAEVLAIFLASITGMPVPLIPSQILMINLVTEGIPALSLGVDPPEKDIMQEPPRDAIHSIFDSRLKRRIITRGIATGLTTLGVFGGTLFLTGNLVRARTMAFANLVSCQMLHAFECSSMSIRRNKALLPAVAISTGLMLASIYIPSLAAVFSMGPLNIEDWLMILLSTTILSRLDDFFKDVLYVTRIRKTPSFGVVN
ncbi:cation-translocating P-type ATPase [Geosporobacter ferrireducens]|uniref:cation-translocating P-type ATPase n=1 Tax=Geosporobacter ferrireducens TaxID=1424294 RepID=UPI0009F694B5|nr:HAD-IC family P-type ATPase [Geosporobacter ferrireducens]